MDSKELQGLLEAYTQVHTTQEVDEAVKGASPHTMEMRKGDAADRRKGIKPLSAKKGEEYAKYKMSQMAHSERKRMGEEVEQIDEISANLALTASQKADEMRRKASVAGDKETASKKAAQASRLYAGVGPRRAKERKKERVDEGMDMKTFKANRKKNERRAASDDAKKRGHVDRFTGKPYGTEEAASRRKDIHTPEKKPSRDAARDAAGGVTGHGGPLRAKNVRKARAMGELGEGVDLFDYLLEYLVAEGYAATNKEALVIMANMSEEWRSEIVEAYVDYEKGKLSTGKSPKQRLAARHERVKATAARERGEASSTDSLMTPATKRAEKLGSVRREMDAHTGLGGKINKALSPGLGGRAGASPRVAYGEPNTDRHQLARFSRGQTSTRG